MKKQQNAYAILFAAACAFALGLRAPSLGSYNANGPLPTRFVQGCLVTYASATTAAVSAGSWRDSTDTYDVRGFSAVASVDCTAAGAAGIDQKVIAQTGSSSSPTITASGDITGNLNTATLTGTIATSTTTLTGTSTKFLSELAVGDLVGTSAKGYSRVTAITSDTAATLVAALPGGDSGAGATAKRFDTPTIWIAATASNKRIVNTISAAGTAIVVDIVPGAVSNLGAGQVLTVGVAPNLASETPNYWLYMWVRSGTSGTTATWSTQRNTPYSIAGYAAAVRRVAAVDMQGGNATPVIAFAYQREVSPFVRDTFFENPQTYTQDAVLSNGTATSWTTINCNNVVPPTARQLLALVSEKATTANTQAYIREAGAGSSSTTRNWLLLTPTTTNPYTVITMLNVNTAQQFDYNVQSGFGVSIGVTVIGFRESL